jgi:hypothetical protein
MIDRQRSARTVGIARQLTDIQQANIDKFTIIMSNDDIKSVPLEPTASISHVITKICKSRLLNIDNFIIKDCENNLIHLDEKQGDIKNRQIYLIEKNVDIASHRYDKRLPKSTFFPRTSERGEDTPVDITVYISSVKEVIQTKLNNTIMRLLSATICQQHYGLTFKELQKKHGCFFF